MVIGFSFGTPVGLASAPTAQAQQPAPEATTTAAIPVPAADALACNCYAYVKSLIPSLPVSSLLKTNTTPHVGAVAIFDYNGLPHYGIITKLTDAGFSIKDSNFDPCQYMTHFISWSNTAIRGFWSP